MDWLTPHCICGVAADEGEVRVMDLEEITPIEALQRAMDALHICQQYLYLTGADTPRMFMFALESELDDMRADVSEARMWARRMRRERDAMRRERDHALERWGICEHVVKMLRRDMAEE